MSKFRPSKKVVLSVVGTVALLVVAGGAGIGLRWLQNHNAEKSETIVRGKPLPKAVEDAQNLRTSGDTKAAETTINKALDNPVTSNNDRYMLYIQQGNIATDKKDYAAAGAAYEKAAEIKQTYEIYMLLGHNWRYAKDNAKAVTYYKKALPLINKDSPLADEDKASLEALIASLEGGPPLQGSEE